MLEKRSEVAANRAAEKTKSTPGFLASGFLTHHPMGRGIDDLRDCRVIVEAQAPPQVTEKKHGLSLPPEYLINDTGEAASAGKFFSDAAVISFRVFLEVRLSADELNSDIQVTNAVGVAVANKFGRCLVSCAQCSSRHLH